MKVSDIVPVTIGFSRTPPSQASFGVGCVLVDHSDVPIDRRYRIVTNPGYLTSLTSGSAAYSWCSTLWGQNYSPSQAYIGRWVSSDSSPYFVCGSHETDLTIWKAIEDGSFTVTTTAGADALTALDFSSVTSIADVCSVIQTGLTDGGVSGATVALDALDRIVFTDPAAGVAGAGSDTVLISASGTGTHLELAAYLDAVGGFAVGGVDAEPLSDAVAAIIAKTNVPFVFCQRGASIAQAVAFSTAINAMKKLCFLVINDTDAKDSTKSSDVGYQLNALGHKNTWVCYTEHTTQNPDAAILGEIFPRTEATTNFALTPLSGVSKSGLDPDGTTAIPLTAEEITALVAKGYDFLVKPSTLVHCVKGLAVDGATEMRLIFGKYFEEAKISEGVYGYMVNQNVVTFSDPDITAIKSIIDYWLKVGVKRKLLDDGYTIEMPAAADFTAAAKATHQMALTDLTEADAQIAVNEVNITLTWNV